MPHPIDIKIYLAADHVVDWQHESVLAQARRLAAGQGNPLAVIGACFRFVRDAVMHSVDFQRGPVTCTASDVLHHRVGYCYAKSHLLAALLRANGIPTALCYQRLRFDGPESPFCLHGLNAVWLNGQGWVRLDARGNKPGVNAQFAPPGEHLAFALEYPGECDVPGFHPRPLVVVVEALRRAPTWQSLLANLPDTGASLI